jgi:hypothetical protein
MRLTEQNVGWLSAVVYTAGSLVAALLFFAAATIGDYNWVGRLGGAAWVFGLMMIILMPSVTPVLRALATGGKIQMPTHDHDAMLREQAARANHEHQK